jgi:tetratricopeptide (TPR) repeat protein
MYVPDEGAIRIQSCSVRGSSLSVDLERLAQAPVSVAEDGRSIAVVAPAGRVEIRALPGGEVIAALSDLSPPPKSLDLSADGSVLAVCVDGAGVDLWDVTAKERLERFTSDVLDDAGIEFSRDGNFLAWVEYGRRSVRFWSPVRGVIQWTPGGPVLLDAAQSVCETYAHVVRFRLATEPFERGRDQLRRRELEQALASFAAVAKILPTYPGLAQSRAEALERHDAARLTSKCEAASDVTEYRAVLALLDSFLRDRAKFSDYGFTGRATTIRKTLELYDRAEAYVKSGREIDAVIAFESAAAITPSLTDHHPRYGELRKNLLQRLEADVETAYADQEFNRVVDLYRGIARLRDLSSTSLLRLGDAHEQLGHLHDAEEVYLRITRSAQEYAPARRSIARMARAEGLHKKARTHLESAREVVSDLVALEIEYAEICDLCKDFDAAVLAWKGVGALQPTDPRPYETVAVIEERRQRWNAAATALREAIRRSDRSRPKLLIKLAGVRVRSARKQDALRVYLELIQVSETDPKSVAFLVDHPGRVPGGAGLGARRG